MRIDKGYEERDNAEKNEKKKKKIGADKRWKCNNVFDGLQID